MEPRRDQGLGPSLGRPRGLRHDHRRVLFPMLRRLLLLGMGLAAAMVAGGGVQAYVYRPRGLAGMKLRTKAEGPGNNAQANIFVDRSCNGCGTCRAMCPGVFGSLGLKSAVLREPKDEVRADGT